MVKYGITILYHISADLAHHEIVRVYVGKGGRNAVKIQYDRVPLIFHWIDISWLNAYKPSALFVGNRLTMETQTNGVNTCSLLLNVKMPTIIGILVFMRKVSFNLSLESLYHTF